MSLKKYCPSFLFPYLQKLKALPDIIIFDWFKLRHKMDEKQVLLFSVSRESLSGNLLFINEKLKGTDFKVNVILENDKTTKVGLLKALAISKYIILDDYTKIIYPLKMRKDTKLIQVWHSTGAFKRMGFSRMGKRGSTIKTSLTHRNYTDVIVSSKGVIHNFSEAFGVDRTSVHAIGVPRTDVFFDEENIKKVQNNLILKYPILKKRKLILFAPTFRGDTREQAYYPREYLNIESLYNSLKSDYVLGIKLHPFIKEKIEVPEQYKDFVIDFSEEREINDLLFITDTLVTDYSSVIFEYALLKKKIVFYAPDLKEYIRDRDFFYDYSDYIYGSFAADHDELVKAIKSPIINEEKINKFYEKYLSACDGNSSQRFVDKIIKEANNNV